jgi:hypothetical protein
VFKRNLARDKGLANLFFSLAALVAGTVDTRQAAVGVNADLKNMCSLNY